MYWGDYIYATVPSDNKDREYPEYTIIKHNTLYGNRDVYIGSPDMDIQIANK